MATKTNDTADRTLEERYEQLIRAGDINSLAAEASAVPLNVLYASRCSAVVDALANQLHTAWDCVKRFAPEDVREAYLGRIKAEWSKLVPPDSAYAPTYAAWFR